MGDESVMFVLESNEAITIAITITSDNPTVALLGHRIANPMVLCDINSGRPVAYVYDHWHHISESAGKNQVNSTSTGSYYVPRPCPSHSNDRLKRSSLALDTWMTAVCQELNTLWQHGTGVLNSTIVHLIQTMYCNLKCLLVIQGNAFTIYRHPTENGFQETPSRI